MSNLNEVEVLNDILSELQNCLITISNHPDRIDGVIVTLESIMGVISLAFQQTGIGWELVDDNSKLNHLLTHTGNRRRLRHFSAS